MHRRRSVSLEYITYKTKGCCTYCGVTLTFRGDNAPTQATRDHVKPKAHGGKDHRWNLVAACMKCNSTRGHLTVHKFRSIFRPGK